MLQKQSEMSSLLLRVIAKEEIEPVACKAAKKKCDFEDIGRYFSALSNEAKLRMAECGWLFLGVSGARQIKGTAYLKEAQVPSTGLQRLKREISQFTNGNLGFEEIHEFEAEGKRIIAFRIPAAQFATPTTWRDTPWSYENDSLVEMPGFKLEAIYGQSRPDWSRQIAYEANPDDLDPDAVTLACSKYRETCGGGQPEIQELSWESILRKMGLLIHGHVSNAALVLLGKPESSVFLGGREPRISWSCFANDGSLLAHEDFEPPFIMQVNRILKKISDAELDFFNAGERLPETGTQRFHPEALRELIHNAIAHQDFRSSGVIEVSEYTNRLVISNEGAFIPGSVEAVLASDYKPPSYRNALLSSAMSKMGMAKRGSTGIRKVFETQRGRFLPMPTYELSGSQRVSVTLYGMVLNENYSRLLAENHAIDLATLFLLDKIQKGIPISREQSRLLHKQGLVRGRYPKLTISAETPATTSSYDKCGRDKNAENDASKELILELLRERPYSRFEIIAALDHNLPTDLSPRQKSDHVSYLLQSLRRSGRITKTGNTSAAKWRVVE